MYCTFMPIPYHNGLYECLLLSEHTTYLLCNFVMIYIYLQLFVGGLMSYLSYMCLFAHSGVQHILCCVFVLFVFTLCTLCCQFLWIVYFLIAPVGILYSLFKSDCYSTLCVANTYRYSCFYKKIW